MDFGKLPNVNHIDFSLPPTPPETVTVLEKADKNKKTDIYVGCPVWGEKDWVGKIYPKGAKPKEFLHYYSTQFNCVEMNTTHYNFPTEILVEKWKADVVPGFKFCPKLPQDISHVNRLMNTDKLVEAFCHSIRQLDDNLGTMFLQLPPDFPPQAIKSVINFMEKWPAGMPLAIEFRHHGWFDDKAVWYEVTSAMEQYKIGTVLSDVAGRRDVCHMRLTTPEVFVRFGANDLHPTDYKRLEVWAKLLDEWATRGLRTVYFFLHTATRHLNLELATYMIDIFNTLGYHVKPPFPYNEPKKNLQESLF